MHDVHIFSQMFLSELAEIYWFRGEIESAKGNKQRSAFYVKKYHEIHDCMRELSLIEPKDSSLQGLKTN